MKTTVKAVLAWHQRQAKHKPRKPVNKVSAKRSAEWKVYVKLKRKFLNTNPMCFKCDKYVHIGQRDLHHFFGKVGALLYYVPGFRTVHRQCHNWIEAHRKESIRLGFRASEELWNRPSLVIDKRNPLVHSA